MSIIVEFLCCCFYNNDGQQLNDIRNTNQTKKSKKHKKQPKPSRIMSKYKIQDIIQISKSQKKQGLPAYTCPICTNYYNKILACDQCDNTVCRNCVRSYQKKYVISSQNMRCPFCNSQKSLFLDYEQEAKKYFDSTGKLQKQNKQNQNPLNKAASKYLDEGNKQYQTRVQQKKDEITTSGVPTDRQQISIKQVHVLNPKTRQELKYTTNSQDQLTQDQILIERQQRQNPELNDISFIDQFQLRTVEDATELQPRQIQV